MTKDASSLRRKATTFAISSACAGPTHRRQERPRARSALARCGRCRAEQVRRDDARGDRVDANADRPPEHRGRTGQADDRVLARVVGDQIRAPTEGADRRGRHDRALALLRCELTEGLADPEEDPADVDADDPIEVRYARLRERRLLACDPGVEVVQVDAAEALDRSAHVPLHLRLARYVCHDGEHVTCRRLPPPPRRLPGSCRRRRPSSLPRRA